MGALQILMICFFFSDNGVITGMKPQLPYGYDDHESFCRDMYPGASLIHHAEARSGRISWDLDSPFGSTEGNIIYCDAEIDGYGRRRGHFALDPEGSFYELQREGDVYFPIYDDYY